MTDRSNNKRGSVEYLDVQPLVYARRPKPPSRAELGAAIDCLVSAYAARYQVLYPEAFAAIRDKAPGLVRAWRNMK